MHFDCEMFTHRIQSAKVKLKIPMSLKSVIACLNNMFLLKALMCSVKTSYKTLTLILWAANVYIQYNYNYYKHAISQNKMVILYGGLIYFSLFIFSIDDGH